MIRTARAVADLGPRRQDLGSAARAADATVRGLGTGLERRDGGEPVTRMPWGLRAGTATQAATESFGNAALAQYAELLRRKRTGERPPVERGLPLVSRRGGATEHGTSAGPGGLARSAVGVDTTVPAEVRVAMRPTAPRTPGEAVPMARPSREGRR